MATRGDTYREEMDGVEFLPGNNGDKLHFA